MSKSRPLALAAIAAATMILAGMASWSGAARSEGPHPGGLSGPGVGFGPGEARWYVETDAAGVPHAIGVELTAAALTGLPPRMNLTSRCFDRDQSGHLTHGECLGDYEVALELPDEVRRQGLPFHWIGLNWNPEGHLDPAPHVWSAAHFDFHFYLAPREEIQAIRPGSCGELIDCDDFRTASIPLAARHQPPDFGDVGAAVPAMGNHLIDRHDPELADPSLGFSKTFIYGSYGGRLIFLEPMVSLAYLGTKPSGCVPLRVPSAWETPGYYPTSYCVRFDPARETYRVSLEGLVPSGS